MDNMQRLANVLRGLEEGQKRFQTPQLAYSSLEDGSILEHDADGQVVSSWGKQYDGTHNVVVVAGPTPPTPVAAQVSAIPGAFEVRWNGKFVGDEVSPLDLKHVSVHLSQTSGAESFLDQKATIRGELGDVATILIPQEGVYYVRLVAWSLAGKPSGFSEEVRVEAAKFVDSQTVDQLLGKVDGVIIEAGQLGEKLEQNKADLAANKIIVDDLKNVKLPAVEQNIANTRTEVAKINTDLGARLTTAESGLSDSKNRLTTAEGRVNDAFIQIDTAKTSASSAQTTANNALADAQRVRSEAISRGTDLVTNGSATLKNNTNFSKFDLRFGDQPVGTMGAFYPRTSAQTGVFLDEMIPVDVNKKYMSSVWVKQNAAGVKARFYFALAPYDTDGLPIAPDHYMEQAGTRTKLTKDLVAGDTTIQVESTANWNNSASGQSYHRKIIFWNYKDGSGKLWPAGTYSRNHKSDAYAPGGAVGNTITLKTPHTGSTVPAGTEISNGNAGGNYMYPISTMDSNEWTRYESPALTGGIHTDNTASATNKFPIMTASVKIAFLANYNVTGGVSEQLFAGVSFSEISANAKLVEQADAKAKLAQDAADAAKTTADSAKTSAAAAQTAADQARTAASSAQSTADTAKTDAATAAGIAGGKADVLIQSTTPAAAMQKATTLWIDTTSSTNKPKRWNGTAWVVVTDKAATDAATAAANAQTKADSAATAAAAADSKAQSALTAAGSAQSTADSALTMAGSKSVVFYSTSAPSGTGVKINDLWRRIDASKNVIGEWYWTGSAWQTSQITNQMISNLDVGKLSVGNGVIADLVSQAIAANTAAFQTVDVKNLFVTTGTMTEAVISKLWADVVMSRKITANMLLVSDGQNFATIDPAAGYADPTRNAIVDSDGLSWLQTSATQPSYVFVSPRTDGMPFKAGDKLQFTATAKANVRTGVTARIWAYPVESNGATNGNTSVASATFYIETTASQVEAEIVIPDTWKTRNDKSYVVGIQGTDLFGKQVSLRDISVLRKATGQVIVDGAVDAVHINASEALSAKVGQFLTVKTDQLVAATGKLSQAIIDKLWTEVVNSRFITTEMLAVGSFDNLNGDPRYELNSFWTGLSAGPDSGFVDPITPNSPDNPTRLLLMNTKTSVISNMSLYANGFTTKNRIPVVPGDAYVCWSYVYSDVADPTVTTVSQRVYFYDSAGAQLSGSAGNMDAGAITKADWVAGQWNKVGGNPLTVPAGAAYMSPRLTVYKGASSSAATAVKWYVGPPHFTRAADGQIVVDGAIDGKTVTGALVQTDNGTNKGIKFSKLLGISAFNDTTGDRTFYVNPVSGDVTMRGKFYSGAETGIATIIDESVLDGWSGVGMQTGYASSTDRQMGFVGIATSQTVAPIGTVRIQAGNWGKPGRNSASRMDLGSAGVEIEHRFTDGTLLHRFRMDKTFGCDLTLFAEGSQTFEIANGYSPTVPLGPFGYTSLRVERNLITMGESGKSRLEFLPTSIRSLHMSNSVQPLTIEGFSTKILGRGTGNNFGAHLEDSASGGRAGLKIVDASKASYFQVEGMWTTTNAANCYVNAAGTLYRSTSSAKNKLAIEDLSADRDDLILSLRAKTWFDRQQSEEMADAVSGIVNGDNFENENLTALRRIPGMVAEEVEAAGLTEFVQYGINGEVEGLMYDRLGVALIPIVARQRDRIDDLERRIQALEA